MTASLPDRSPQPGFAWRVGVVILAAGASSRMGRPKLLLPWAGTTILGYLIHQWQGRGVGQVAVVCAAGDSRLAEELDRLAFRPEDKILNSHPERGMFSSIQCAARWSGWNPRLTHWVIALGDQPHLRRGTSQALLDFAAAHPDRICQPSRQGHPEHPVVLPKRAFLDLGTAKEPTRRSSLKDRPSETALGELADPGLDVDIDHPDDYLRAQQLSGGHRTQTEVGPDERLVHAEICTPRRERYAE